MLKQSSVKALAIAAAAVLTLGCAGQGATNTSASAPAGETKTIEVQDNHGTQTVTVPPASVVATDNRTFQTLADWDVQLSAAPRTLIPKNNRYATDESIVNLGSHNEPNLEAVVAVEPDLIVNGQRFAQYRDDFAKLTPDATILELDPRDDEPLDAELTRQTTVLGEIFGKETEAEKLTGDLDAAIGRAKTAYDPAQEVMAVTVSGGNIGYIAPGVGRTLGPVFPLVGLTPALEIDDASNDHQGDEISVEAIAASNPDWILVMDRDAAVSADDPAYKPASEILENSEALTNVTAIREGNIVYLPADAYTNEGIQMYTTFFTEFADALEGKG